MSSAAKAPIPETREGLLAQNRAYRTLCASLEAQMAILTEKGREYHEAVTTLDSERAANARLTDEVESLRWWAFNHVDCLLLYATSYPNDSHARDAVAFAHLIAPERTLRIGNQIKSAGHHPAAHRLGHTRASAIEARKGQDGEAGLIADESAVPQADAERTVS